MHIGIRIFRPVSVILQSVHLSVISHKTWDITKDSFKGSSVNTIIHCRLKIYCVYLFANQVLNLMKDSNLRLKLNALPLS